MMVVQVAKAVALKLLRTAPGTLLATKRMRRELGRWRLVSHQTIPYCDNTVASQSIVCNSRGCILLKR